MQNVNKIRYSGEIINELNFIERNNCKCCDSKNIEIVFERKYSDPCVYDFIYNYYQGSIKKEHMLNQPYTIAQCQDCDFLFQKYVLSAKSSYDLYEKIIDPEYSLNKKEKGSYFLFSNIIRSASIVREFFPNKIPRSVKVLDYGMGWGHWAIAANALGFSVKGFELSSKRINFARLHGVDVINDLSKNHNKFDFINTDQVFEHLDEPFTIGKNLVNKLNRNGILKIFIPNGNKAIREIRNPAWKISKNYLHPLEHINCFCFKSINTLITRLGLRPASINDLQTTSMKLRYLKQFQFQKIPSWYYKLV